MAGDHWSLSSFADASFKGEAELYFPTHIRDELVESGLGAKACGAPFWDQAFNCCDVLMLLDIDELAPRYARRFLP